MMKFRNLSGCLALALVVLTAGLPVQADMVGTVQMQEASVMAQYADNADQRDWIQAQLLQGGVAEAEATLRVAAMTNTEIAQIYQRIDEAPAGGANILILALVVFAVLEITGYIDVIPEK